MFDRFTDSARKVMALARGEAARMNHEYIGTEHLLLGLILAEGSTAVNVLQNFGIDLNKIRHEIEKLVQKGPPFVYCGQLPFSPRSKKVLELSVEEASNLGHNYIGTEHLLLGLIHENDGVAAQVLLKAGLRLEETRQEIRGLLAGLDESEVRSERRAIKVAQATDLLAEWYRGKIKAPELMRRLQEIF